MKAYKDGGAILSSGEAKLYLTNVTFDNCTSNRFGGAVKAQIYDIQNATFSNCQSKIGGGLFLSEQQDKTINYIQNVVYYNNSATIIGDNVYILAKQGVIKDKIQYAQFLKMDKLIQYSYNVVGTDLEFVEIPYVTQPIFTPSRSIDFMKLTLQNGMIHVIKLTFYHIDQTEFTEQQSLGNLYDLLTDANKPSFSQIEIEDIHYPYLVIKYYQYRDCILSDDENDLYELIYFDGYKFSDLQSGCLISTTACSSNMISIQSECSYCSNDYFTIDQQNCISCNNNLFDQCYANISKLKPSFWRQSISASETDIYPCNLNFKSCGGENRNSVGNDLCSEGYIGIQCSSCDISGDYWGSSYGESGQFSCMKCSYFLQNKRAFLIISICFTILILFFTLWSNYYRMERQILRKYLSGMHIMYVGTSFLRRSQLAVYIKIILFNFQIYLTTNFFVSFDKSDNLSFHSSFYSFFNILQNSSSSSIQCFLKESFPDSDNVILLKLQITVLLPLFVNIAVILILIPLIVFFKLRWNTLIYVSSHCIGYTIFFVWMQQILLQSIASHQCINLTQENQYLILDRQINCSDSDAISSFHKYSIPAIVIYAVLVPFIYFIGLIAFRKQLEKIRTLRLFGFLYDEYKRKYFYWQFIKITLSQLLTVILQLSSTKQIFSGLVYCGILILYLLSIIKYMPFQQSAINRIEKTSTFLQILYLLASLSIEAANGIEDSYEVDSMNSTIANIFYYSVLVCLIIFYIYMVLMMSQTLTDKYASKLQRFRIYRYLSRYFPNLFYVQNFSRLRVNFEKWRKKVKEIQYCEMKTMKVSQDLHSLTNETLLVRSVTMN